MTLRVAHQLPDPLPWVEDRTAGPAPVRLALALVMTCLLGLTAAPSWAEMALDKVIVDFKPAKPSRDDIEITNGGDEVLYVSVEPVEIVNPGRPDEQRATNPNPRQLGLLISPTRLALGPGERKIVRFSLLERPVERDRIYRVAIKPVVGEITAMQSALKVVVGYDVLVIARPQNVHPLLVAARDGNTLELRNLGNTNVLLFNGEQCGSPRQIACVELPSKRIYAGNSWQLDLPGDGPAKFLVESADGTTVDTF